MISLQDKKCHFVVTASISSVVCLYPLNANLKTITFIVYTKSCKSFLNSCRYENSPFSSMKSRLSLRCRCSQGHHTLFHQLLKTLQHGCFQGKGFCVSATDLSTHVKFLVHQSHFLSFFSLSLLKLNLIVLECWYILLSYLRRYHFIYNQTNTNNFHLYSAISRSSMELCKEC